MASKLAAWFRAPDGVLRRIACLEVVRKRLHSGYRCACESELLPWSQPGGTNSGDFDLGLRLSGHAITRFRVQPYLAAKLTDSESLLRDNNHSWPRRPVRADGSEPRDIRGRSCNRIYQGSITTTPGMLCPGSRKARVRRPRLTGGQSARHRKRERFARHDANERG